MWEIWAILMLPKALKRCPKSDKSPNLVTLITGGMAWDTRQQKFPTEFKTGDIRT